MSRALVFITLLFFGFSHSIVGQSFNLGFLFNSGAVLSADYFAPSAVNDSVDFQALKYKFKVTTALKTKMGVDLKGFDFKKMDAKASQVFINYGLNVLQPSFDGQDNVDIYSGHVGIMAITASIRKGIWVYAGDIYLDENSSSMTENPMPNFRGYFANVKIKNLKFQYFYGAGTVINQGKVYPFPVLGFRSKLNKKWKFDLVVPQHARLNFEPSNKLNFDLATNFSGINTIYRSGSALNGDDNTLNLRRMKTYLAVNNKLGSHYKMRTEIGYAYLQQINEVDGDERMDVDPSLYVSLTLNYYFGKSVFGNFLNRIE